MGGCTFARGYRKKMSQESIEDSAEYKRIYSKYANHRGGSGGIGGNVVPTGADTFHYANSGAAAAAKAAEAGYTSFKDVRGTNEVPDIEDADPNETPAAAIPTSRVDHPTSKLDKYRICGRCQGLGEYKDYLSMGHGATREITKCCDKDLDGGPCDGGIVRKDWREIQSKRDSEPVRPNDKRKTKHASSDGKFDGTSEPSAETEHEQACLRADRQHNIE